MSRMRLSIGAATLVAAAFAALVGCAPTQTTKPATEEELKAKRDSAQQYYSMGANYYQQGEFQSALENFRKALTYDSTYYEVYVATGLAYRKMLDPITAEENFRKAIKLDPKKPKAYEGLGDLFFTLARSDSGQAASTGQQDSARLAAAGLSDSARASAKAWRDSAKLRASGRYQAALGVYTEGLSHDSSLVDLYNGAAEVYVVQGEMGKADSLYQVAMRRFPDDVGVQRLWADFLFKQERYAEAVSSLSPLVQRFPKVWELREKLADCYIDLKQYDKAAAQLDTILASEPGRDQTALRLGSVYLAWGKTKQAIQVFDALIAKDSTKTLPRTYKAEALMKQGNYGSAEAILETVLRMDPNTAQAHVDLGDIRQRQADEARGDVITRTTTAKLKQAKSLYEEAKSHYARALSDPNLRGYAEAKTDYANKALQAVDRELFVRE